MASPLQVPSVDDLTSGRARIDALRPIAIEDLLGRDEVPVDPQLLGPGICDAVVCVTGAGFNRFGALSPDPELVAGKAHSSREQRAGLVRDRAELRELVSERW